MIIILQADGLSSYFRKDPITLNLHGSMLMLQEDALLYHNKCKQFYPIIFLAKPSVQNRTVFLYTRSNSLVRIGLYS